MFHIAMGTKQNKIDSKLSSCRIKFIFASFESLCGGEFIYDHGGSAGVEINKVEIYEFIVV